MSTATSKPVHPPGILDTPSLSDAEAEPQTERGRKRRRSSAAYQNTQLPSTTLRGRGRRRSSSLHLKEGFAVQDQPELERHRSRSPDRRSHIHGKEGQAKAKYAKKSSSDVRDSQGDDVAQTVEIPQEPKKRRDQSPSRSRSQDHEGDAKLRRRQRTRSRSRSHRHDKDSSPLLEKARQRGEVSLKLHDEDDEVAVED